MTLFNKISILLVLLVVSMSGMAQAQTCPLGDTPVTVVVRAAGGLTPNTPPNADITANTTTGVYPTNVRLWIINDGTAGGTSASIAMFPMTLPSNRKVISAELKMTILNVIGAGGVTAQFSAYGTSGFFNEWGMPSQVAAKLAASYTSPLWSQPVYVGTVVQNAIPAPQVDTAVVLGWSNFTMAIHKSNANNAYAQFNTKTAALALQPALTLKHCQRP